MIVFLVGKYSWTTGWNISQNAQGTRRETPWTSCQLVSNLKMTKKRVILSSHLRALEAFRLTRVWTVGGDHRHKHTHTERKCFFTQLLISHKYYTLRWSNHACFFSEEKRYEEITPITSYKTSNKIHFSFSSHGRRSAREKPDSP